MHAGRVIAATVAGFALLAAVSCRNGAGRAAERTPVVHAVTIEGSEFRPSIVAAHVGDRVVWTNKDFFPHTATAPDTFDSGTIAAGASWTFTLAAAGTFDYTCAFHPTMTGTIRVE